MKTYSITAEAEGDAVVVVTAENEAEAEKVAYIDHLTGISIFGGSAHWNITDIREIESE